MSDDILARLDAQFDCSIQREAAARIRELTAAIEFAEAGNGGMWHFWCEKAAELANDLGAERQRSVWAEAENAALRAAADGLAGALEWWKTVAEHCSISDGVCCCGDDIILGENRDS